MTSYLEANLEALSGFQPGLARYLSTAAQPQIEVFNSVKQQPTARCIRSDGSIVPLHSRYDPLQEARRAVGNVDLTGADYFILLGFGLGYLLDALLELPGSLSNHYFIIESDPGILKAAFSLRDWSSILASHHVHFAHPAQGPALAEQWASFFDPIHAHKTVYVTHAPSLVLDPALFKSAVALIQSQTFQTFTDINTLVDKSGVFLDNFIENLPAAASAPGVSEFAGRFAGRPAVLVSAGPSLDKNVHELRGCEDKILILAADTALKPLLKAGVTPHFVLTGDPSLANYLHLKDAQANGTFLVAEATAYPAVFREFSGRIIVCTYQNSSLGAVSDLLGSKGSLRAWGSVATMGLDFALHLGCNPIIFAGQDLAHSEGRTYCSGVYFEDGWFAGIKGPVEWKRRLEEIRAGRKTMQAQDLFGRPVETTDKLSAYWNWISKEISRRPDVQFINATEGGILKDNVAVCSLREAIHRHSSIGPKPGTLIDGIFKNALRTEVNGDILVRLKQESVRIARILEAGKRLCRDSQHSEGSLLRNRLEALKDSIYENRNIAPILDSFNQMGNVAFLRNRGQMCGTRTPRDAGEVVGTIYLEYFESVATALAKINGALNLLMTATRNLVLTSANASEQGTYTKEIGLTDGESGSTERAVF